MTDVRFNLKEPTSETNTLIIAFFSFPKNRMVLSTGESVHPKNWNPEKQRVRYNRSYPESIEINNTLDRYDKIIKSAYRRLLVNGQVTVPLLRTAVLVDLNKEKKEAGVTFMEFFKQFIQELKKIRPYNSMKRFNTLYNYMLTMQVQQPFSWDEIDIEWFRRFQAFMITEKGFSKNFFASMVSILKRVLNEATDRGINSCLKYQSKVFKREWEDIHNIYLTIPELEKLHAHDFSTTPKIDRVCDIFLVGCFTGMRFSDYSRLNESNFTSDGFVFQDMKKEAGRVIIPLHPIVKEILAKYNGKLPKAISNQKFNEYLKKMGEAAGLDEQVNITRTEGGVKVTHTFKKYEVICTHTARRSLATNMNNAGVQIHTIMAITGHKSVKQFLNYIKVTEKEIAQSLVNHPFFKPEAPATNPGPQEDLKKSQSKKVSKGKGK